MKNNENIIKNLTNDGEYATDICLLLELDEKGSFYLGMLDELDIKWRKLEKLWEDCSNFDIEIFKETVFLLYLSLINKEDVKNNLNSEHPIPFVNEVYKETNGMDDKYDCYTTQFYNRYRNNKR